MIFVLYRLKIPFARLLFAVKYADDCIGRQVRILGWYRLGLRPYVEMLTLTDEDGKTHRTWSHWVQYAFELVSIAAGLSWWMFLH